MTLSMMAVASPEAQLAASVSTSGMGMTDNASCFAYTSCPYGGAISCETWGYGCSWWTVPGSSVQCTGHDFYGRWLTFYYRCY